MLVAAGDEHCEAEVPATVGVPPSRVLEGIGDLRPVGVIGPGMQMTFEVGAPPVVVRVDVGG